MNLGVILTVLVVIIAGLVEVGIYLHQHRTQKAENGDNHEPVKWGVGEALKFWALGDRVLIREDEFRSGYECQKCHGKGHLPCENCGGTQLTSTGKKCSICDGTDGQLTCPVCGGKGGLIIVPDVSQRRPTSGSVVSVGHKVKTLKPGDAVLYSNFSGHVVDFALGDENVTMRILHDTEVLAGMEGHLTLSRIKGKTEIAQFTN